MVNNSKILTVSYGTFSCTLEGFDDSFGTMKAIAEYFRDLASDDRYFGAEPPQLDAEMLARIAQRQISSPVAAYEGESGIVLRAEATDSANEVTTPVAKDPAGEDTIKDVVENTETAKIEETEALVSEPPAKEAIAAVDAQDIEPEIPTANTVPMQDYVEPEIVRKDDIVPAADSIAAKLQRIRAVVSRNEATAQGAVFAEDENSDALLGAPVTLQNDEFEDEDLIATVAATDKVVAEENVVEKAIVEENSDVALDLSALTQDDDPQDDVAEIEEDEAIDEIAKALAAYDEAETTDATDNETVSESDSDVSSDDLSTSEDDDLFGDDVDENLDVNIDDDEGDDDDLSNLLADVRNADKAGKASGQPRVLKIKRADFEAAVASGQIETDDETDTSDESTLSDEDEAELLRDLAEVEAEAEVEADDDTGLRDIEDPLESDFAYDDEDTEVKANLPPAADEDGNGLSRLMDAADTKMDDPENSSSREAYSHLRAAVAVANAEHAAGSTVSDHTDDGAYREDLASVVRPRRPDAKSEVTPSKRPSRPSIGKPAPLKLVAEQRVDDQAGQAQRGPVRPRRVSAVPVDETFLASENIEGFAQFAHEMGATDLPDLLEAAAAYMSFVEGREQFSRPQLMTKVRQIETSNFNREDGLRSFGKLLRDGKIQKTNGGRFTASEDIGFRPDERAAG
ncbi:MAG: hypothetical protein JKY94_15555 [Rhodobacteraceae bacterium]|nr:hypothetical protein [Paracoccaceae bacterium]